MPVTEAAAAGREFIRALQGLARRGHRGTSLEVIGRFLLDRNVTRGAESSLKRTLAGIGRPPDSADLGRVLHELAAAGSPPDAAVEAEIAKVLALRDTADAEITRAKTKQAVGQSGAAPQIPPTRYRDVPQAGQTAARDLVRSFFGVLSRQTNGNWNASTLQREFEIGTTQAGQVSNGRLAIPPDIFEKLVDRTVLPGSASIDEASAELAARYLRDQAPLYRDDTRWTPSLNAIERYARGSRAVSSNADSPRSSSSDLPPDPALDQLCRHLGRRSQLPKFGESSASGLALRVHPAISLDEESTQSVDDDQNLPTFVTRDVNEQVAGWLRNASRSGGFLLLIGDSCVGKTRLLYEAAKSELSDFSVLAPELGNGELINQVARATFPMPKMVVWLDELQRFLNGPYLHSGDTAITSRAINLLLNASSPVVILGTLWPEHSAQLRRSDSGGSPVHPSAMEILGNSRMHEVVIRSFSFGERQRARELAKGDARLARALADTTYNVTEFLAGVRELINRYDRATDPQRAIVYALVDAKRARFTDLISPEILCRLARCYLGRVERGHSWFEDAINELASDRRRADRSTSVLMSIPNADRTENMAYYVADYLHQQLTRERKSVSIPHNAWCILFDNLNNPLKGIAMAHAAIDLDQLESACAIYGRIGDGGDLAAAYRHAELLLELGNEKELRERAERGEPAALCRLARKLSESGHTDEAIGLLKGQSTSSHRLLRENLTEMLIENNFKDGAIAYLRTRLAGDDLTAIFQLAELQIAAGTPEDIVLELRDRVLSGRWPTGESLAILLLEFGLEEFAEAEVGVSTESSRAMQVAKIIVEEGWEVWLEEEESDHAFMGPFEAFHHRFTLGLDMNSRARKGDVTAAYMVAEWETRRGDYADALINFDRLADQGHWPSLIRAAKIREQIDSGTHKK